jgi:hypothetical protein
LKRECRRNPDKKFSMHGNTKSGIKKAMHAHGFLCGSGTNQINWLAGQGLEPATSAK